MEEDRDFVYVRLDPLVADGKPSVGKAGKHTEHALKQAYVAKATREGFSANEDRIVIEYVSASTPASDRPNLMKLLGLLAPFNELVVWHLDDLARSAADILTTIDIVKRQRLSDVYCLAVSPNQLANEKQFMTTLKLLAQIEGRSAQNFSSPNRNVSSGRVGRHSSLNEETKAAVRAALQQGDTVSAVAKRFGTSRQTVLRIRTAEAKAEQDETQPFQERLL